MVCFTSQKFFLHAYCTSLRLWRQEKILLHESYKDAKTYQPAIEELWQHVLSVLRLKTLEKLRSLKPRILRTRSRPSLKFASEIGLKICRENPNFWRKCKCGNAVAKNLRDEIWPRPAKGRGHRKQNKLDWVESQISSESRLKNAVAKRKYVELFDRLPSQNAWSKASKRIRQKLQLQVSLESVEENKKSCTEI